MLIVSILGSIGSAGIFDDFKLLVIFPGSGGPRLKDVFMMKTMRRNSV